MAKKNTTDKIKDIAKSVSEAAEPYIEIAKEKSAPVIDEVAKKTEPAISGAKEVTEPYLDKVKEKAEPVISGVKKATEPAANAVKKQGTRAADAVRNATRDIAESASKKNLKAEFFIQYKDYEIRAEDIAEKIREKYASEGNNAADIRELQVYLKPEENMAYYVINHRETGKYSY